MPDPLFAPNLRISPALARPAMPHPPIQAHRHRDHQCAPYSHDRSSPCNRRPTSG